MANWSRQKRDSVSQTPTNFEFVEFEGKALALQESKSLTIRQ